MAAPKANASLDDDEYADSDFDEAPGSVAAKPGKRQSNAAASQQTKKPRKV